MAERKCTRKCSKCKQKLPVSAFSKDRSKPSGLSCRCRECRSAHSKQQYAADPNKYRAAAKRWRKANPEKVRAINTRYREADPEKVRVANSRWKKANVKAIRQHERKAQLRKYGMIQEDYDRLFEKQNGNCAICGEPPDGENLAVDHDRNTGTIRGLLHKRCNIGIGSLRHDPQICRNAAIYLEAYGK